MLLIALYGLTTVGFLLAAYGYYVELQLKKNPHYKPLCNISDKASCTKTFTSSYGKTFDLSNTIIGMYFYAGCLFLLYKGWYEFFFTAVFIAFLASFYYAYLLFFKVKTLCPLCIATYCINIALVVVGWFFTCSCVS